MPISFKHHDTLRLFNEVAQHNSFSDAAKALHMTKGAISYQIKTLEEDLAIKLFERNSRGVELTRQGRQLLNVSLPHYREVETELARMNGAVDQSLTVGMSSYFASRWLSPRLMTFMQEYPGIQLRIQPMTQLFDLERQGVDLAIRWGDGDWDDVEVEPIHANAFLACWQPRRGRASSPGRIGTGVFLSSHCCVIVMIAMPGRIGSKQQNCLIKHVKTLS